MIVKMAEPPETSIEVRMPASFPANSRSRPMKAPKAIARTKFMSICSRGIIYVNFNIYGLCRQAFKWIKN